ncbi:MULTISPECIES: PTS lactose/cellobiose transporter subunit IIA [Thermoactinomyces]|jgi:cellobiose PTS system EIIA component|uniref:PTS lactose/cellobiose transporter subunit IIA n=1 Tax=Thermoactinomyces daqus TaxID=1329516 RepID=A0A7W1XAS8_9BACL|nr:MULTISPECIES: PTS lactose/cellobiose transporter subunit IIA [Thermoactinomyces]MBA4543174.1 PTS lactose/cellobiose transporter subunit IIA [Thermoactinomyces daqus]MBH8596589.1 PTS lactose/cellobiose transporter subunit IIA [Thermoactinomyces sp. CICC 10523]MBH8603351.1 PTS lactose/cellobiose transporter subunit IIA [Thermoactinomyces sp. CICC 10522]MBH8607882.1 PTS lactose/cellobiose transporter subunit IIA [Thermoactinomyces sp. CICC 10521]
MENAEKVIFQIIIHGGNGRSCAMEAIAAAKQGRFSEAREKLQQAGEELNQAHHIQTSLIQEEVKGVKREISLLMVHAQDHLMNAITVKDLATELVDLYEYLKI